MLLVCAALAGGAVIVAVCARWALSPETTRVVDAQLPPPRAQSRPILAAINPADFALTLWTPGPATQAPTQSSQPVEPPKVAKVQPQSRLQLVGIISELRPDDTSGLSAALYDPDTDAIVFVTDGATVGDRTVRITGPHVVSLAARDGSAQRLVLREEGP